MYNNNDYDYKDGKLMEPMKTDELFIRICEIMRDRNEMPDNILEYAHPTGNSVPITDYKFVQTNLLDFGCCEGIYCDEGIRLRENGRYIEYSLGSFKTCDETQEAMEIMGKLNADFVYEITRYVNANLDNFTWEGYDVDYYKDGMEYGGTSGFKTRDDAVQRAKKFAEEHDGENIAVVIRDNSTRKEWRYEVSGN